MFLLLLFITMAQLDMVHHQVIRSGSGTKSVVISPDGERVYAQNLEDMSVYEFDRKSRKLLRVLRFKKTPGKGYNYRKKIWINSYQEKPVEACFTHNGKFLWISLHNAGGVVVWDLEDTLKTIEHYPHRKVSLKYMETGNVKTGDLLFIETGKTPKVIEKSRDGRYLFVANWHSNNVSVIDISGGDPFTWKKITDIPTGRIPRGIAVSEDNKLLYIAEMSSDRIRIVEMDTWKKTGFIHAGLNPRHLVIKDNYLYASINISGKVVKIDLKAEKVIKSSKTGRLARTLAISPDGKYVFVVSYRDNILDVFQADNLKRLYRLKTGYEPVGLAIYQDGNTIEAWVSCYSGRIDIFTFLRTEVDSMTSSTIIEK